MELEKRQLIKSLSGWLQEISKFAPPSPHIFQLHSAILKNPEKIDKFLLQLKEIEGPCIYRISIPNLKFCSKIRQCFEYFHEENLPKEKAIKRNLSRMMEKESEFLYVGSSRNHIHRRIKQHLGYANHRIYSLDLKFWFPPNIKLKIEVYPVRLNNDLLIFMEQKLWANSKPMFGKQSGQ